MIGTESSHDEPVSMHPLAADEGQIPADYDVTTADVREDVTAQTHAVMPDPVIPVTLAPVQAAPVKEHDVSMKEIAQMVGAMVFVFGFAALGLHAISYAGY